MDIATEITNMYEQINHN